MSDELEDALRGVALGDDTEIARVARYLRSNEQAAGQSAVQQQLQSLHGRAAFMKKVHTWMRDTPNMLHDDELYARAVEIDSQLAQRHPDMDERRRLDMAADLAIDELGDPESRGYSEDIAKTVAKGRQHTVHEEAERTQVSRDPEDIARREDIAAMAEGRGPHVNEAAEEQREYESRKPKPQRGERQHPHVDRRSTVAVYDRYGRRTG